MSAVTPFLFEGNDVRVISTADGEPWFVAADVCRCLEIGNPRDAVKRLDTDEKMTVDNTDGHSGQRGGAQEFNIVNEAGLYRLIFTSRKAAAERFKRWLAHDVLPALRRTGVYIMPGAPAVAELDSEVERMWLAKINLSLRVHGRQAARELWDISPLPQPSASARRVAETVEDGAACLRKLLSVPVGDHGAVGELIVAAKVSEKACGLLHPFGLRIDVPSYDGFLVVADSHPVLMSIFAGTRWESGWRRALLSIPGAQAAYNIRFRRVLVNAVAVPLRLERGLD